MIGLMELVGELQSSPECQQGKVATMATGSSVRQLNSRTSNGCLNGKGSARDTDPKPLPEKIRCTDEFCNALFPVESVHHCVVTNQPFCEYDYPIHVRGESYVERYRNGRVEIVTKPGCGPCTLHQEQQRERFGK